MSYNNTESIQISTDDFITDPTAQEYVKELNRLNYIFRRKTAFKILESDAERLVINIFDKPVTIEHSAEGYKKLPLMTIAAFVQDTIIKAYQEFVYKERRIAIHPSFRKIPKTIKFKGKNEKLANISRTIQIQIAKNIPLFRLACKYFGLRCTFWDIYKLSRLPACVFEMEPAYINILSIMNDDISSYQNKQDLYKLVHSKINNKAIASILPKLSCKTARQFVERFHYSMDIPINLTSNITKQDPISEICKYLVGSPTFNQCILGLTGMENKWLEDVIYLGAAYSKKKGKSKYAARKFEEIRDWMIQTGIKLDKNQKKCGFEYLIKKSDEWHAKMLEEKENTVNKTSWQPLIGDFELGGVKIKELSDSLALYREGQAMKHCVAGYSDLCRTYKSVIFSLTDGKNFATAEFRILNKKSSLGQLKGRYNAQIAAKSPLYKVTSKIAAKLNAKLKDSDISKNFDISKVDEANSAENVPF